MAQTQTQAPEIPKVSYGRIVRDEQGNVIDIILEEDEEVQEQQEDGVKGALNPEREYEPEAVEAKTDVVRCEFIFHFCRESPSRVQPPTPAPSASV
jgi:hypothetical protein